MVMKTMYWSKMVLYHSHFLDAEEYFFLFWINMIFSYLQISPLQVVKLDHWLSVHA